MAHELLRRANSDARATSRIGDYLSWLPAHGFAAFDGYDDLWE